MAHGVLEIAMKSNINLSLLNKQKEETKKRRKKLKTGSDFTTANNIMHPDNADPAFFE